MVKKTTKSNLLSGIAGGALLFSGSVCATEIDTNIAQMQAMDKITGKVSVIDVPVNGSVNFGSFSILVRACKTRPPEDTPENFAFVDVIDTYNAKDPVNIFRGWMISSSPALNPVEHPIYDVWLLKCINGTVNPKLILSKEELDARDAIKKAPLFSEEDKLKSSTEQEVVPVSSQQTQPMSVSPSLPKVEEIKLQTQSVSSPAVLLESDVQADITTSQEDGAPKSLLNIQNDFVLPSQSETSNSEKIQPDNPVPNNDINNSKAESDNPSFDIDEIDKELSQMQ